MSVSKALLPSSSLRSQVRIGKRALRLVDRRRIEETEMGRVVDSLDLDEALRRLAPGTSRWDYLIGTTVRSTRVIAVEVHPANTGEARDVIRKKHAAVAALRSHLETAATIMRWYWIASGATRITRTTPEARMLDRAGITLVGSHLRLATD